MTINIIAVGKMQKNFQVIFDNYRKKISFYANVNIIEIKEQNNENKDLQRKKETKLILDRIPKSSKVFLCSLKGKKLNSIEFSKTIDFANITFVIGGSDGVDESYFENKINFSSMTFPHQLFRIILIEQIYRGLAIRNNSKYHK